MFSSILIGFILGRYEGFIVNYGKQKNVDRLSQLINYLDKDYVDKIDTDSLVGQVIEDIVEELDPHSTYIPLSPIVPIPNLRTPRPRQPRARLLPRRHEGHREAEGVLRERVVPLLDELLVPAHSRARGETLFTGLVAEAAPCPPPPSCGRAPTVARAPG